MNIDHKIDLILGSMPLTCPSYRMSPLELGKLRENLSKLIQAGMIHPLKAPYGAPIQFPKKQDGSLCIFVDYQALNKVIVKNKYSMVLVYNLMDSLSKASFYSKLESRSSY